MQSIKLEGVCQDRFKQVNLETSETAQLVFTCTVSDVLRPDCLQRARIDDNQLWASEHSTEALHNMGCRMGYSLLPFQAFWGQIAATGEDGWQWMLCFRSQKLHVDCILFELWEVKSSSNLQGNHVVIPAEDLESLLNRICNECPLYKHHYKSFKNKKTSCYP